MYSRYHKPSDTPIQLPENYGGVAFSETPAFKSDAAPPFHPLEVAKPSPPPPSEGRQTNTPTTPMEAPPPPRSSPTTDHTSSTPPHATTTALLPMAGKDGFPFSHGIGIEELFIIALIILLSRNEQASDMVLWLTLLLFCG